MGEPGDALNESTAQIFMDYIKRFILYEILVIHHLGESVRLMIFDDVINSVSWVEVRGT